MQLYGFEASYHGLFKITGTFHNPGPFSGFVVSALPLAVVGYTFGYTERHKGDTEKDREISLRGVKFNFNPRKIFRGFFKGLSILTIIAILLIVPAAQSRAAWLAGGVGYLYVLLANRERFPVIKRLSDRFRRLNVLLRTSIVESTATNEIMKEMKNILTETKNSKPIFHIIKVPLGGI